MSSNKQWLPTLRGAFFAGDDELRCIWRLLGAYLGWFALFIGASIATGSALSAMFSAWGVTSRNLALYPMWVQYLAVYQTRIAFGICGALTALAGRLAYRRYAAPLPRPGLRALVGFGAGALAVALLTGLFLLGDSMRLESISPALSADIPIMLAYCVVVALAEGLLAIGYVREMTAARGGIFAAYAAAAAMFLIMNHSAVSSVTGLINLVFIALAGCCIAERFGVSAFVGLRAGWLWAEAALAGYPGSTGPIFSVYPVSEHLLTGDYNGLSEGLFATLCCAAVIFIHLIYP